MLSGQNPVDILCNLPVLPAAGSFIVTDPRGQSPLGFIGLGQTAFYSVNFRNGAIQRLPDFPAGLAFGAGTCAAFDASRGRVWVFGPGLGAPDDSYTGFYVIATATWVNADAGASMDALLANTWGTDGTLASLDSSLSSAYPITNAVDPVDLFLRGAGLNTAYQFSVDNDRWRASANPGAASGAGTSVAPLWGFFDNGVLSFHGGGSVLLRMYLVSADAWSNINVFPPFTAAPAAGTSAITHPDGRLMLVRLNATGQVYAIDITTTVAGSAAAVPYARLLDTDGVASVGSKLCAYKQADDTYLVVLLHGSTQVQRIRIVE